MEQPEHPPIILKTYDFTLWLLPKVEKSLPSEIAMHRVVTTDRYPAP
jgi:hypothetical protein